MGATNPEDWNWDGTDWSGTSDSKTRKARTKRRPYGNYAGSDPQTNSDNDIFGVGNLSIRKSDSVVMIRGEEIGNLNNIPEMVKGLKKMLSKMLLKET